MVDVNTVYNTILRHEWWHTYEGEKNPMECYCGARSDDHSRHIAEQIAKALDSPENGV